MTTSIEEALRSGAVRLVPGEATPEMIEAGHAEYEKAMLGKRDCNAAFLRRWSAMLSASSDHTAALLALIEELREKVRQSALDYLALDGQATEALERALAAEAKCDALREALAPFAEAAAAYDPDEGDGANAAWMHDFTIASLRRARALTGDTP